MGAFGVMLGTLHYLGLYLQLSVFLGQGGGAVEVENHISSNALFTEVPHDIRAQRGEDVEMACSFRGSGSPSYSLEIQWWYIRNHKEWNEQQTWDTNQVVPQDEVSKDATKISVVKVAGSNISHKLRLSSVKPSDEGTYECRVIDFSDSQLRHHRVRAYLQVEPDPRDSSPSSSRHQGAAAAAAASPGATDSAPEPHKRHGNHKAGRELRKRSANDCTDSCAL